MGGSIWSPGSTPQVNVDTLRVTQEFTATAGQTTFNLTSFTYAYGTGSLEVIKNGLVLSPSSVAEVIGGASFSIAPCSLGDKILAVGLVGITGVANIPADGSVTNTKLSGALVVPVANGGTGAATAAAARTNLGALGTADIGVAVQAYNANTPTVVASSAEMVAGTETSIRSMSPNLVAQAITTLGDITVKDNFLPNVQWQAFTTGYLTKQNAAGTADQTVVSCTGFQTSNNAPLFYTTDTQELKAGDIVTANIQIGYTGIGYVSTAQAFRVSAVNPGASVQLAPMAFGGVTPAVSAACTLTPITGGVSGAGSGQCADGWKKSTTLTTWADDFSTNSCVGALRTLGIRKGSASSEELSWYAPTAQIRRYAGKTITFGVFVKQKVQAGAGTWQVGIHDSVSGWTLSSSGTGITYSDPVYGTFEFKTVTKTVAAAATSLQLSVLFNGASSDVYYVALPTAGFGVSLRRENCKQSTNDLLRPVGHWNPPLLTPFVVEFPATSYPGTPGLYGWSGIDLEAISLGAVHKSVTAVKCKIELLGTNVGKYLFTGSKLDYSLIFGPQQAIQVSGVNCVGQGWLPLADDGTFCLFSDLASFRPTAATFDFDLIQLNQACSMN